MRTSEDGHTTVIGEAGLSVTRRQQPSAPSGPPDAPRGMPRALAAWRQELVDLGGPSPLLGPGDLQAHALDLGHAHPSGIASFLAGRATRLSHLFREVSVLDDARARARAIRLEAHALADEHGLHASVLAVGLASWREASGATVSTPVLLRPLELRPRGSGAVDYELDLGSPVRTNPALVRELARRGVALDPSELSRLAQREHGFDPAPALERLRALTRSAAPEIEVRTALLVTALVDVAPALADHLDRAADHLATADVPLALAGDDAAVARLAEAATAAAAPARGPSLDDVRVLPLDPSQRRVVAAVLGGASLRVEAGPGTGATQVGAALVAALVGAGRRVLLVPGQQVELADVTARLATLGLAGPVLGAVGADPVRPDTAADGEPPRGRGGPEAAAPEPGPGAELAAATSGLHVARRPWGVSVLDAFAALTRLESGDAAPATTVTLPRPAMAAMGLRERDHLAEQLGEAIELGALSVSAGDTPWSGADLTDRGDAEAALTTVADLRAQVLPDLRAQVRVMSRATGLREPASVSEAGELLALMVAVRSTLDLFTPRVYDRSVADLVDATASGADRAARGIHVGMLARRRAERTAHELLRPGVVAPDLHRALGTAEASREAWLSWQVPETAGALPVVPRGLPQTEALCAAAVEDLATLQPTLATTAAGGDLPSAGWDQLEERLAQLEQDSGALEALPRRTALLVQLRSAGLGPLLDDLRERRVPAERAGAELERAWWTSVLEVAMEDDPGLARLDGARRADLVAALRGDERRRTGGAVRSVADAGAYLRRQGHVPCRISSPLALPHELGRGARHDVVVLLGAHRTGVPEAVLAAASGDQVVLVGDPGGLPVAQFSPRAPDAAPAPARWSVLDASVRALPTHRLEEQHRMPAELAELVGMVPGSVTGRASLPGPAWQVGASFSRVSAGTGPVDAAGSVESPEAEVARVVDLVTEHARTTPEESLAVVALTRVHARRLADALRAAYGTRRELQAFLGAPAGPRQEAFVVTDVGRSGDTVRDAAIVSVGFGVTPLGRFDHRLGPLDGPHGQRSLATALSRARSRLVLVSSVGSEQLEPDRLTTPAARALRAVVLRLEEAGRVAPTRPVPSDPLLVRLLPELEAAAREGVAGDRADELADGAPRVRAWVPGGGTVDLLVTGAQDAPAVAVLTDLVGAHAWSGGEAPDVRDSGTVDPGALLQREVALPDELGRLGWRVVRLGAVELFADPGAAARRVLAELRRP